MSRWFWLVLVVAGLGIVAASLVTAPGSPAADARGSTPPQHKVSIGGSYGAYDAADLAAHADLIAVVTPVGEANVHWNNRANEPWATDRLGRTSLIFRDQLVRVHQVLRGTLDSEQLMIRGAGGRLGDFEIVYDDDILLQQGTAYVVFLRLEETPTREGIESMWATLWQGHGVFRPDPAGTWRNIMGMALDESLQRQITI